MTNIEITIRIILIVCFIGIFICAIRLIKINKALDKLARNIWNWGLLKEGIHMGYFTKSSIIHREANAIEDDGIFIQSLSAWDDFYRGGYSAKDAIREDIENLL